jgi:hypothetical protein
VSSAGIPREPIPVLEALGREFDRAVRDAPRPQRSLVAPGWRLIIPVLIAVMVAFMTLTAPGRALVHEVGELVGVADDKAAIESICAKTRYCKVIEGIDTPAGSTRTRLVTPGDALAGQGRTVNSCPEAAAAYAAAGIGVDAFVGPCPAPAALPAPTESGGDRHLDRALDDLPGM